MINYKKRYYELVEDFTEVSRENRELRKLYNYAMQKNEELSRLLDNQEFKEVFDNKHVKV